MIKNEEGFATSLLKINEWWLKGRTRIAEKYPKKRVVFSKLKREIKSRRIMLLSGPRRVGKSVLLHQLIQELLESGVPAESITYYPLDDPSILPHTNEPLKDIIEYALEKSKGKAYVILDEIQANKGWHKWIKAFYDRGLEVKFVLSGSSSLTIQADANKYLRGRTVECELFPLDFKEFLFFHSLPVPHIGKKDATTIAKIQRQLETAVEEYLLVGGFPEWFEIRGEEDSTARWLTQLLVDIPKKAIFEDIAAYYRIRSPVTLRLLLNVLAINQSKILSYEKINRSVNLDRATLLDYIEFLKASYLILEIPVHGSPKKQIKAMKKFLLVDPGLRNALTKEYALQEENKGFAVENAVGVALALNHTNVNYWKEAMHEVDYVVQDVPIEVKYKNVIEKKDYRSVIKFLVQNRKKYGVVITKNTFEEKKVKEKIIRFIPSWVFLLEPGIVFPSQVF